MPKDINFYAASIAQEMSRALAASLADANLKIETATEQIQACQATIQARMDDLAAKDAEIAALKAQLATKAEP